MLRVNILSKYLRRLQHQQYFWNASGCSHPVLTIITRNISAAATTENKESKRSLYMKRLGDDWEMAKPFRQIPGPTRYQMVRGFMKGGEFEKLSFFDLLHVLRQRYGDTYIMPGIGKPSVVCIFDPVDFERVYRTEGKYPNRPGTEAITFYREERREELFKETIGMAASDQEWGDFRSKVTPVLMKTQNVRLYLDSMMHVKDKFVQHIRKTRDPVTLEMPDNFNEDITHFTFETMTVVALDKHLGLIGQEKLEGDEATLFESIHIFNDSLYELGVKPNIYKYIRTPTYKLFEKAMDDIYNITKKYIDESIEQIKRRGESKETRSMLEQLLKINRDVAILMAMDMITGGVDTSSSTLSAALLLLASNPEKQDKLRNEIRNAVAQDKDGRLTYENTKHLPYLRACIKEAMRIYPLTAGNFRITGMDVALGGYRVPKGSHVFINSNMILQEERYFSQPKQFIPERWLRGNNDKDVSIVERLHPFVFLPFGFGPRSCVGQRIVNLQLELILASLVLEFVMEFHYPLKNAFQFKFFNYPVIPMKIKFSDLTESNIK